KVFHITHPRQHAKDIFQRTEPAKHLKLRQEIVKIEVRRPEFLFEPGGFFFVNRFGGSLNQTDHVAHTQNPPGEPLRIEWFKLLNLFTASGKLDPTPRYFSHGERSPTAGVAIEFRQDQARQLERALEMCRNANRLLAGRRIANKKNLLWLQHLGKLLQFPDQSLIYFKTTGSI